MYIRREEWKLEWKATFNVFDVSNGRPSSGCWWGRLKYEQRSFVLHGRLNTDERYDGYNLLQNADFSANVQQRFEENVVCVMCHVFSPSRAVLSYDMLWIF